MKSDTLMSNAFLSLLEEAKAKKWCTRPMCTTCGALDFRRRLKKLAGPDGSELAEALATIDIGDLTKSEQWPDCLRIALEFVNRADHGDNILNSWLPRLPENTMLADVILYYHVRQGIIFAPMSLETRDNWIRVCAEIAMKQQNISIMESLVYTLGKGIEKHAGLKEAALKASTTSPKLHKALAKFGIGMGGE